MKKVIIFAAILLSCSTGMQAQTENGDNDDVITVTDKDGKAEEIEVPTGLEDNLDSLLHLYNAQTYMMPDTTCNYKDENRTYPKEVYIDRLKRLPTIIEMPYNEVVQKLSTAIAASYAALSALCWEPAISTCLSSRRLWRHTTCLWN